MDSLVKEKKIVAIIPARGGSKRIPKKNIIDFKGKPMIRWTIEAALKCNIFADVFVSTDSDDIKEVSIASGASIHERVRFNDDHSPVSAVAQDFLKNSPEKYDIVVMLMANCPIRDVNDIKNSLKNFLSSNSKFQISSFKYGWMNPWWAHKVDQSTNVAVPIFQKLTKRSQDLDELHCPTGAIWIADVESLIESGTFYGNNYTMFDLNWKNAVDIDDYEDLELAEIIFELKKIRSF